MIRNLILIVLLTLVNRNSFAQEALSDSTLANKLFTPYQTYFSPDREWIYPHFNKSAYVQGDDVWFTTYLLNPANKRLYFATSKLYVELWSPEKKLIARKILFAEEGTAGYFIHLSDTLAPGSYCFRAYTNWMRNFYPENDFNTYITVLGNEKVFGNELVVKHFIKSVDLEAKKELVAVPDTVPDYDIQFLPESGTFLEGTDNVFGIKALDPYGKGVKIGGKIFSADNRVVTSFSTNDLGMNNVTIPQATNQQYIAKVTLPNGTERELKLPKTAPIGVIIHTNPSLADTSWIRIKTNGTTRQLNKQYLLLIHSDGSVFKAYRFGFLNGNAINVNVLKKNLSSGIVTATMFDENLAPVAERIFYNPDKTRKGNLTVHCEKLVNDSLKLNINLADSVSTSDPAKLSISVLPGESHLNHFTNSLYAETILRPALRGNIENPNIYFDKNDTIHSVAIDNLLLTQGWRKYDWPTILKDSLPKITYPFEEGFIVEGTVKNWLKNKPEQKSEITLISPQNDLVLWTRADSSGQYKIDKLYLNDSTWVIASASNNKGRNMNRVLKMSIPESFMGIPEIRTPFVLRDKPKEIIGDLPRLTKGTILLDEVMVKSKKKNPFANNVNIGLMDKVLTLTKENYRQFTNMTMLLASNFGIMVDKDEDGEYHINMGRGSNSFRETPREPMLMIDGIKARDTRDIIDFPIELVEAVAVNKSGFGGGFDATEGTIAIKTRATPLFENTADPYNIKRLAVNGYAPPARYFEPKYVISPTSSDYEKFACVYWKPSLIIDKTKTASFRFFAPPSIRSLSVRIEGISLSGKIFLHEQKIEIPGR